MSLNLPLTNNYTVSAVPTFFLITNPVMLPRMIGAHVTEMCVCLSVWKTSVKGDRSGKQLSFQLPDPPPVDRSLVRACVLPLSPTTSTNQVKLLRQKKVSSTKPSPCDEQAVLWWVVLRGRKMTSWVEIRSSPRCCRKIFTYMQVRLATRDFKTNSSIAMDRYWYDMIW